MIAQHNAIRLAGMVRVELNYTPIYPINPILSHPSVIPSIVDNLKLGS